MKRDMDLIRELLLKLEDLCQKADSVLVIKKDSEELQVDGYNSEQIGYHLSLLREARLILPDKGGTTRGMYFQGLSWSGHDFVDSVRDPEVWSKAKSGARQAGGFTLELMKDLALGFIKKKIKEQTDIEL